MNLDAPSLVTLDGIKPDMAYLIYRSGGGGTVEIYDIFVDNAIRGKKNGRRLLEKLFAILGPCVKVWAITRAENFAAQQFYEKCLFRTSIPLRDFYGTRDENKHKTVDAVMYLRSSEGPV